MKIKKIISAASIAILLMSLFVSPAFAASEKNETVYGILDYDGSVKNVYVVNQLIDEYVDYGNYTQIKNLSSDSEPVIDGDKITFPDEQIQGGLYYQGTMADSELPITFEILYYLDGNQVKAQDLGGKDGHLRIEINYAINQNCDKSLTDGIIAQIMLTLNKDLATNINYFDGIGVVVGNTMNISYTSLFEETGQAELEADVTDFEMDSISISILKGAFSLDEYEETLDGFFDGFNNMQDGAGELVDGTSELQTGITSLVSGIRRLSNGLSDIKAAGDKISDGNNAYASGLKKYTDSIVALSGGSSQIKSGLDELASNASTISSGVSSASNSLAELAASSSNLEALATSLMSSSDPEVQALAAGTLQTLSGLNGVSQGLSSASNGLESYSSGVSETATSFAAFNSGLKQLADNSTEIHVGFEEIASGFNRYLSGISGSASGIKSLYYSIKILPDDVQQLVDAQIQFEEGISEKNDELRSETEFLDSSDSIVSFASPSKNTPNSVQYVLVTADIERPSISENIEAEEGTDNFFTRLADLFR